jgi:hypothetical protein
MKTAITILIFSSLVLQFSCTKDHASAPVAAFVCSQTSVTYTKQIKIILDQYCAISGCHAGANSSGILLDDYANSKSNFKVGNTLCTIKHQNGCKPMPYPSTASPLSDSLVTIIECWITNDFPN